MITTQPEHSAATAAESELLASTIRLEAEKVTLQGPNARWTILVSAENSAGHSVDLTRSATYRSADPTTASVSPQGVVRGVSDGDTTIDVEVEGRTLVLPVTVTATKREQPVHFENDIIPILSRFGYHTSGCHDKAEGQNGFKLSIFGFDPESDLSALSEEGRGRRLVLPVPEKSLLLLKASGGMPHGGGVRIRRNSGEYRLMAEWIASGAQFGPENSPRVESIRITPSDGRSGMNAAQQLQVVATFLDGRQADVTHHAKFQSNNEGLAVVDEFGLVKTLGTPGEAAIMASYMGAVDVYRAVIPQPQSGQPFPQRPVHNFIDELVDARLQKLGIHPSELCTDADFLRRAHLDIIGTLPTREEARAFLADQSKDKRARLVDALLKRPEYADLQALRWADLLRVDRLKLGHKQAYSYYQWIHASFAANKPMDEFARDIVASEGSLSKHPAGNLYKVVTSPGAVASTVSQVFLGVRIECAQCHHHPFDRWSQADYYGMQAFFTQTGFKGSSTGEMLLSNKNATTTHPRSKRVVQAHALLEPEPEETPEGDRRRLFAEWMTSPDNRWFAKNIVNRVWAQFLGRGIVEPVDDVRLTNPPTNPELLDALAKHFVESGFDMHQLIRTITASRTYQLSATPNELNESDEQNYSRALLKRMGAEVRLDMICQVTGIPEKFDGVPHGSRAVQLWDSQVSHYFLKLFGRPIRATACECERATQPSVGQVLHVLNSPEIHGKLADDGGTLAALTRSIQDDEKLIAELYLLFYSRYPTNEESQGLVRYLAGVSNRREAVEDVAWSLMNTVEFMFNH